MAAPEDPEHDAASPEESASGVQPAVWELARDLLPVFYDDLKRIAKRERRRGKSSDTLQTTALVHEAYLRLRSAKGWNDEQHFLRAAALAMRHALIKHATARVAQKRGQGAIHVPLTEALQLAMDNDDMLIALDDALNRLAIESPRLARVVECRFFAGYDELETAKALGISERTVRRDWTLARAWLHRELGLSVAVASH